jgi:hypothetical protein|tara:strand:- start:710 stop:1006 length:297 start_codon:yes stop_codon:yes gene_type:complete
MKTTICNLIRKNKKNNKIKTVTLDVAGVSQGQWSTFLLELNLMKKAWKSYGVDVELKTKNLKKIITQGTNNGSYFIERRNVSSGRSDKKDDGGNRVIK